MHTPRAQPCARGSEEGGMNTSRSQKRRSMPNVPHNDRDDAPCFIVAMTLAREMAETVGAVGEDKTDIIHAALAVGQWLAEVHRPGRWDTLQVAPVLKLLPSDDEREQGRFLLTLAGLLGYAGLAGHLPVADARRCLLEVQALAADPIIRNFARRTARGFGPAGAGSARRRRAGSS
jgi:hypothetical protein